MIGTTKNEFSSIVRFKKHRAVLSIRKNGDNSYIKKQFHKMKHCKEKKNNGKCCLFVTNRMHAYLTCALHFSADHCSCALPMQTTRLHRHQHCHTFV